MARGKGKNIILVADDDFFFRTLIRNCVADYADVIEVKNGSEVLEHYAEHTPDMIFLDIHMPDAQGTDILSEIMKRDPQAFVVMVSADSVTEKVLGTKQQGAKGFIGKPFKRDTILRYLTACPTLNLHDAAQKSAP
ncbi:MAG: response regulator [Alphaproteobacteria bacterium]|nr:response regulator [Alphaproteobacteria bacterium]